jgi:hypothetical protein
MRWCTKFPLIECHKGHHVSFSGRGERKVLWYTAGHELHHHHEPLLCEFCIWSGITVEGVESYSAMAWGGRRNNAPKILVFPLFPFLSPSLSLFLFPALFLFQMKGRR